MLESEAAAVLWVGDLGEAETQDRGATLREQWEL